jgi:serine/threonine-protein kinase RsbT
VASNDSLLLVSEQDIVVARQTIRKAAQEIGFSLVDQTKIVTAASELARNAVVYGGGGTLEWAIVTQNGRHGLQLIFKDRGPGIADLTLAMKDGWTSGREGMERDRWAHSSRRSNQSDRSQPGTAQ